MAYLRLIARLDVKGPDLIKGVHLEGVRKLGDPHAFALRYYEEGIDEILFIDAVASLYGRNNLLEMVSRTAERVFIPITVGGGLRSVDDVRDALRAGADKVAINTAAVKRPELISEVAERFGSQCLVLSVQAKRRPGGWEAYVDLGREHTGLDAVDWAERGVALGAGEVLITSVDQEGTGKGFDLELTRTIAERVRVPVIASGGFARVEHLVEVARAGADAVAIGSALHYGRLSLAQIREAGIRSAINLRPVAA
jgi:cyclase